MFQSAPLREGRPGGAMLFRPSPGEVSIRAPARGATRRSSSRPGSRRCRRFQSAPLREGRPDRLFDDRERQDVSIRAPARGATSIAMAHDIGSMVFQSAPLREGRPGRCAQ